MQRINIKRLFCNKIDIKGTIDTHKKQHLKFNKNLENITKEFSLYEIETINNRKNFLDPTINKNELEHYIDSFNIQDNEINIDLKTLSSLNFPVVLYEMNKNFNMFHKYTDILTKTSLVVFLLINAKFLLSFNFLFQHTFIAQATLYCSTISTYYLYKSYKIISGNSVLELKVNPKNKTMIITYINSPFTFPLIKEIPINKFKITLNNEDNDIKYFINIDNPKLKKKEFIMYKDGSYYQESLLCSLFKIKKDDKINNI
jgi:hypothetical protein